jgi:hypothetical protein
LALSSLAFFLLYQSNKSVLWIVKMKTYSALLLALYSITTLVAGTQDYCNQGFKPKQDGDYQLDLSPMNKYVVVKGHHLAHVYSLF